ncbi:hypothetical protein, partial [Streptomyces yanii]|uniref:hypothetical protein n=1 Tax=Streptomyces yanii TaxID=78510 RepID=UPI003CD05BB8
MINVTAGDVTDRQAAADMLPQLRDRFPTITKTVGRRAATPATSSTGLWPPCIWSSLSSNAATTSPASSYYHAVGWW